MAPPDNHYLYKEEDHGAGATTEAATSVGAVGPQQEEDRAVEEAHPSSVSSHSGNRATASSAEESPSLNSKSHQSNGRSSRRRSRSRSRSLSNAHNVISSLTSRSKKNRSSLELRRLPVSILFASEYKASDAQDDEVAPDTHQKRQQQEAMDAGCLRRTCLNSKLSLRTQMMLSFGLVSFFTIGLVISVCIWVSILSGDEVNDITRQSFVDLIESKEGDTARYLAESLSLKLIPSDLIHLLHEATLDRMAGYPIYKDDSQVPFYDTISESNRYPLKGPPAPLDWQIYDIPGAHLVNKHNYQEHVQDRWSWYQEGAPLSTARAAYFMQGMCDPSVTDPSGHTYFPDCSSANNNITTGGVVSPSPTNQMVYEKTSDLGPLLKSLYEFYTDVKELGLYMANGGAGGTLVFPHYELNTSTTYVSIGCNWLLEPHPYDRDKLIGTLADHERCEANGLHVNGARVSSRVYNPLDREWCKAQAQNPEKIQVYGPYASAWHTQEWLMSVGQAVYDRVTQEFVGCIGVDYVLDSVEAGVTASKVTANSHVTLIRNDRVGTVVSSSKWNMSTADRVVAIDHIGVGLSQANYARLRNLVNFDTMWDPLEVRKAFEEFRVEDDGYLVSAYPMPPPPEEYDPFYRPDFFAISSISKLDIDSEVENVSDSVEDTVKNLTYRCLLAGVAGLGLVILLIFVVSHSITLPLKYMNEVSSDIIDTFGNLKEEEISVSRTSSEFRCSPHTELSEVVKQFQKMVSRFSGSAMAKSMKVNVTEIENRFDQPQDFRDLYYSRDEPDFPYRYVSNANSSLEVGPNGQGTNAGDSNSLVPMRVHRGSILNESTTTETSAFRNSDFKMGKTLTSPLFFWILALIVTPLLFTTVGISAFATYSISQGLFDIIDDAKTEYVFLDLYALQVHSDLRAAYGAMTLRKSVRDNFVLMRYTSWLLFGGLERTDSFTELLSGVEECKGMIDVAECSSVYDFVCDCEWNDRFGRFGTCDQFSNDTRHLQKTSFMGLADDALPNGDRVSSSYPNNSYSSAATMWWDNVTNLPGAEKGAAAAGHDTTYDRVRVTSAFPFFQAFYNSEPAKDTFLSNYVFFEADGLGIGYEGCSVGFLGLADFVSTESNGASRINSELCPLGKYGYDPRCRDWYATGRSLALTNSSGLYVSPPYHFASATHLFGQTCTSPLIDPATDEHVGQTLVDFLSQPIFDSLDKKNTVLEEGGFPFVITGIDDAKGANTVIGPGFSLVEEASVPISNIVLPYDDPCPLDDCKRRAEFEAILKRMKRGESDTTQFTRSTSAGTEEIIYVAFAPINTNMFIPVNSSDASRGVNVSDYLIYSLALAKPQKGLLSHFKKVEDQIRKQVAIAIVVLAFVIGFSVVLVFYISNRITLSMIEPMFYLLQLIRHINELDVDGAPPGVEIDHSYGSRETLNVVETMEALYKIVQSANVAFFAGDVEKAYAVLADAARLFKRLGNNKAEGVAKNNLGNTMLAFYRRMQATGEEFVSGLSQREVIGKGMGYFHRAVQLGEKAYDEFHQNEGWSPRCLEFMQHLSNRYFNRAMFLLTVKDGHESPLELESQGLRDLQIAKDMDLEIVDQGSEVGWDIRGVEQIFDVYLSRIRGHIILLDMGYDDKWDVSELLDGAFNVVRREFSRSASSPLFKEFCPAGRMQQIETELMKYKVLKGDLPCAAKIAIRILVEDDFTLPEAQLNAVEVLLTYLGSCEAENGENQARMDAKEQLEVYRLWLSQATEENDRSRSQTDESDASLPSTFKKSMRKLHDSDVSKVSCDRSRLRMSSRRASTRGDVTMEIF